MLFLAEKRIAQMLETEVFQSMLRGVLAELIRDHNLKETQQYIRCRALNELMDDIQRLMHQHCRREKVKGKRQSLMIGLK